MPEERRCRKTCFGQLSTCSQKQQSVSGIEWTYACKEKRNFAQKYRTRTVVFLLSISNDPLEQFIDICWLSWSRPTNNWLWRWRVSRLRLIFRCTSAISCSVMANVRLLYVEVPVRPARVHAPQGTSTALRSPARGFCARILSFSFCYCQWSFLRMPWQSTEKETKKRHLKNDLLELCSKILCILSKISWRSFGLFCATAPLKKMNACTVRVRNRSRRRRISKRWKKQLWWIRKIFLNIFWTISLSLSDRAAWPGPLPCESDNDVAQNGD